MGCDYYEDCYMKISLKDGTLLDILIDRSSIYADYEYDSDFEDDEMNQRVIYEAKLSTSAKKNNKNLYSNA